MPKDFTSITLENYDNDELAEEIVAYLRKKNVKQVEVKVVEELKEEPVNETYSLDNFDKLKGRIIDCLEDDGLNFHLDISEIKTTFDSFAYGIEANSPEGDFKEVFSKYE